MHSDTFILSEILAEFQKNPSDVLENYSSLNIRESEIVSLLNEITDYLAVSADSINEENIFAGSLVVISRFGEFDREGQERIVDLFTSVFNNQIIRASEVLTEEDQNTNGSHTQIHKFHESNSFHDTSNISLSIEEENHAEPIEINFASVIGEVKERISRYGFLIYLLLNQLEESCQNEIKKITTSTQGSRRLAKKPETLAFMLKLIGISLVSTYQGLVSLSHSLPPQQSKLINRIFSTRVECSTFIGMVLKPVYRFMESDIILKNSNDKLFSILCLAVVEFDEIQNVQSCMGQLFLYFEHIAEPLGELLFTLYDKYKNTGLYEEIVKYIISREFNPNDNKGPKAVALLIGRLVHLSPELVLKQFREICRLLDSKHYTLRSAVVEAAGIILYNLCKNAVISHTETSITEEEQEQELRSPSNAGFEKTLLDIKSLFDLLEERVLDINPYTRIRAIQALTNLTELNAKFNKRRPRMTELAVQSLQDKSSLVRRNALRLLSRLISTHPFNYLNEDGRLNLSIWEEKLRAVQLELKKLDNDSNFEANTEIKNLENLGSTWKLKNTVECVILENNEVSSSSQENPIADNPVVTKLQLALAYHTEAVGFIKKVHEGLVVALKLLNSKNKTETIESMDLFVLADAYGIETARSGVRLMIHLVWAKGGGNNDEALAIQKHLLSCYKSLFFDPPSDVSSIEANNIVARSLISLTYGATISEAASLERLLSFAMEPSALVVSSQKLSLSTQLKQDATEPDHAITELVNKTIPTTCMISDDVINVLWKIYGYNQSMAKSQRRGAIIIIGMLAKEKPSVISSVGLELLLRIGLGDLGRIDFKLAKYSCIALQRMINTSNNFRLKSASKKASDHSISEKKFCANHEVIRRLASFIILPSVSMEWFSLCEEAINAVYSICDSPDIVLSHLIRLKTKQVFSPNHPSLEIEHRELGLNYLDIAKNIDGNSSLAQLLFIVGHTSLKTLVYLENLEGQFKRRKIETERERAQEMEAKTSTSSHGPKLSRKEQEQEMTQEQEFNLIGGGTTEDDFSENLVYIRETELMFGHHSLLSRFGPLISTLCLEIIRDIQNQEYSEANAHWERTAQVKLGVDFQSTQHNSPKRRHSKMLVVSATLSLIKMMCVSSEFCSNNLSILVTILEHTSKLINPVIQSKYEIGDGYDAAHEDTSENNDSKNYSTKVINFEEIDDYNTAAIVRSNIVLGMGDLAVQFNHELEDNMQFVYKRLRDHTKMVQRTTLLTLTFLILAGQVKAKDQQLLGQMARCLEDKDETIANLAHIFFLELAAKDNAIYNNFIDMFNSLVSYTKKSEEMAKREGDDPDDVEYSISHASIRVDNNILRRSSRRSDINHNIPNQAYDKYVEDSMVDINTDENAHKCNDAEDFESFEPLTREALHRILKFLVSLVDKERYIRQLSEKLAKRLEKCETPQMWDHLSYVLSLLPHKNEEIADIISAGFKKNIPVITETVLRNNSEIEDFYDKQIDIQDENGIDI